MENLSLIAVLSFGLLASFGHCIGMCGGIVVAYSALKLDGSYSKTKSFFAHLFYSLGRTTSYVLLGVFVSVFGAVISISPAIKSILMALLAFVMFTMALSLLGKIKLFYSASSGTIGQNASYKKAFARLLESKKLASFYGIGVLNGFIPCAPVYVALAMAFSTGTITGGIVTMLVYGLATTPSLLLLGITVGFMRSFSYRDLFNKLAAITVILYGIFVFTKAIMPWI